jgi:DNA-3-methyladenine glycosylase I
VPDNLIRCDWPGDDELMRVYHDVEWGTPCHDDHKLFELLMLDCFQAGLSWRTILHRRAGFAEAFEGWDPERLASYGEDDQARLMADPRIIRNRLKVKAATTNARAFLAIQQGFGSFDAYLWSFVNGTPIRRFNAETYRELPATSAESDALSKDLRKRGFNFVGSTIVYAFMQSVGMVNDHTSACFRSAQLG